MSHFSVKITVGDFCSVENLRAREISGQTRGVASCKTSARGETLSTTPHHLQSKACNVCTAAEGVCAKCIGRPQNGQCGCGASVSMPRA